jgi:2-polyprenyl-3-methyl-5-hydroxy-6-metoxy-1,4-benzoquinol methylase
MCKTIYPTEDALTERLFQGTISALELFSVYLGKRLGLYETLAGATSMTVAELSETAGVHERYAREWLEQQAVAGILVVANPRDAADQRRFLLPEAHRGVLADGEHAAHVAPFAQLLVGVAQALPDVAAAYRSGGGVEYARYGADLREGQGAINRPAFSTELTESWLAGLPDVWRRLQAGEAVRIADVGCGQGWSSIAMAKAFPNAEVVAVDLDVASIEDARKHAAERGADVELICGDARTLRDRGPFDLVIILEALHDMARPTEVLGQLRACLAEGGCILVGDERVAETFMAPGDDIERMMYGWSISHCLPASMCESPSEAIGTVIRPSIVQACAKNAGFASCDILPVENDLFRFYRLAG